MKIARCQGPFKLRSPLSIAIEGFLACKCFNLCRRLNELSCPNDFFQAVGAGLDILDNVGLSNQPDFEALFCSELFTRALRIAQLVDPAINPSEQTPADVMQFSCLQEPIVINEWG